MPRLTDSCSEPKKLPRLQRGRFLVGAITRDEFIASCGFELSRSNPIAEENGWFSDETYSFLGVVIRDKIDNDWSYVVLARDQQFQFRAVEVESSLSSRDEARMKLQIKMAEMLTEPKRIPVPAQIEQSPVPIQRLHFPLPSHGLQVLSRIETSGITPSPLHSPQIPVPLHLEQ
jgi:hypothetical protein